MTAAWRKIVRPEIAVVAAACGAFAWLALAHAVKAAPTYDEPAHLASGYSIWRWGDYRVNPEHPPLLKCLAAAGLLMLDPWPGDWRAPAEVDTTGDNAKARRQVAQAWELALEKADAQWLLGHTLLYAMRDGALTSRGVEDAYHVDPRQPPTRADYSNDATRLMFVARVPMVALGVLLVVGVFAWARRLYGVPAACAAAAFLAFDPSFIAHASLVTTDVGLALALFGTVALLWHAWDSGSRWALAGSALCVGVAFASKYSAVLIPPILLAIVAAAPPGFELSRSIRPWGSRLAWALRMLAAIAVAAWLAIWLVYGLRWSAAAPPESRRLPLENQLARAEAIADFRAAHSERATLPTDLEPSKAQLDGMEAWIGLVAETRLLPEAYVYGFAWVHLKSLGRFSFLRGEHLAYGAWDYFPWAFLLKTPIATLALLALALFTLGLERGRARRDLTFLLLPAAIWFAVAVGSSLNIGHRHLLPIYPFLYVFMAGRLARSARSAAVLGAVVALSSMVVFAPPWNPSAVHPHPLAFFNELAGGPAQGHRFLVDSNLDWGQDLGELEHWVDQRGLEQPIGLCYFGSADPRYYGIPHVKMPGGYDFEPPFGGRARFEDLALPGYVAISATNLQGVYFSPELRQAWRDYLAGAEHVGTAGRSIFIFRISGTGI